MTKLIFNKHFISFLGLSILCTSVFLLFSSFHASKAMNNAISLSLDKSAPLTEMVTVSAYISGGIMADSIMLSFTGPTTREVTMIKETGSYFYKYQWDTKTFLNGDYTLNASFQNDVEIFSGSLVTNVKNLNIIFRRPTPEQTIGGNFDIKTESNYENTTVKYSIINTSATQVTTLNGISAGLFNTAILDTIPLANGTYKLLAEASFENLTTSNHIIFNLNNINPSIEITTPVNGAKVQGTATIKAITTPQNPGQVKLIIKNEDLGTNIVLPTVFSNLTNNFSADLNTLELANSDYTVIAICDQLGTAINDQIVITVDNTVVAPTPTPSTDTNTKITSDSTISTDPVVQIEPIITFSDYNYIIYSSVAFSATCNIHPSSFEFIIYNNNESQVFRQAGKEIATNKYGFLWPATLPFGGYSIVAKALFPNELKTESIQIEYKNKDEVVESVPVPNETETVIPNNTVSETTATPVPVSNTNPTSNPTSIPTTTPAPRPSTITPTPISSTPIAPRVVAPNPTTNTTALPKQTAPIVTNTVSTPIQNNIINQECTVLGINDKIACQIYLSLPYICKKNNIITKAECNLFLELPHDCQVSGISNLEECQTFLKAQSLPTICKEAGISNQNDCRERIEKNNLPDSCIKENILNFNACNEFLKKDSPKKESNTRCLALGIKSKKLCDKYLEWSNINPECELVQKFDIQECREYLINSFGAKMCKEVGIVDMPECESYLINNFTNKAECIEKDSWECSTVLNDNLALITSTQSKFEQLEKIAKSDNGTATQKELVEKLGNLSNFLPLNNADAKYKLVNTKKQILISDRLIQTSPMAVMIDTDQDGLSDDMEKRIGTDPVGKDSDGDSFDDFEEYKNGYNPLGKGKIDNFKPAPVDEAILNGLSLEHPKAISGSDQNLEISEINKENKILNGKATPNYVYTIFVYSDLPIITTVQTDEFGNWQYTFQESMIDGEHEVYIALNDNTGKIVSKSKAFNFFIKEAKAVSVDDFISNTTVSPNKKSNNMLVIYLITAFAAIIVGLSTFVVYLKYYKSSIKAE